MTDSVRLVESRGGLPIVEIDVTVGVRPEMLLEFEVLLHRLLEVEGVSWVKVNDTPLELVKQIVERVKEDERRVAG